MHLNDLIDFILRERRLTLRSDRNEAVCFLGSGVQETENSINKEH